MAEESVSGSFEIHVFVGPLDPSMDRVVRFRSVCAEAPAPMRALLLHLDYVDRGFVGVMQTSRYVTGDVAVAREAVRADAAVLRKAGFEVIREKVEAVAVNPGVPQITEQARSSPAERYFEFHLLIEGHEGPLSEADAAAVQGVSKRASSRLSQPVPASYNALQPGQRFLNLRAPRGVGLTDAMRSVRALQREIESVRNLSVKKVVAEYVCFDSNRAVDDGWLEPLP